MTRSLRNILLVSGLMLASGAYAGPKVAVRNMGQSISDGFLSVHADFFLDSLELKGNRQLFITPIVEGSGAEQRIVMPSVLVNGRNMHYAYERGSLKGFEDMERHEILSEVMRQNGKAQTVSYLSRVPAEGWMRRGSARVVFVYDSCGCGVGNAPQLGPVIPIPNPADEMYPVMMTPKVTELPVEIHEGRARVQFEVDKTVLHDSIYICRNGQRIDNRAQLRMIDDSVRYALSDPNVEIAQIAICGYASPESPYLHNEYLATNRSRALAEYLADRYHLPRERTSYSSVPENWGEFREEVIGSNELTEQQRADLLALIDRPVYGPSDYDDKEKDLKTSPKFAKLYKTKILPEWFPRLRATTFAISTRLKPMSDEALAEVIKTNPEKMSLNQMFRVAKLYPEGSREFNDVVRIALATYPDDPVANLNVAAALIGEGKYEEAKPLLEKAGDSAEAWNLRGIVATSEGEFEEAAQMFGRAAILPEAKRNAAMVGKD